MLSMSTRNYLTVLFAELWKVFGIKVTKEGVKKKDKIFFQDGIRNLKRRR